MNHPTKDIAAKPNPPLTAKDLRTGKFAAGSAYEFEFKITSDEQYLITSDEQYLFAIELMMGLEQGPNPAENKELAILADAVEAYELAQGHIPEPPVTLRGILEVEMFKRRIRQRQLAEMLEVTEPRLSELMKGKRELNMDFARRLYTKLQIPADVIFSIAT